MSHENWNSLINNVLFYSSTIIFSFVDIYNIMDILYVLQTAKNEYQLRFKTQNHPSSQTQTNLNAYFKERNYQNTAQKGRYT